MSEKKIVRYSALIGDVAVGFSALLRPVDHPDEANVTNTCPARTSTVVAHDPGTGRIETKHTIYMPVKAA